MSNQGKKFDLVAEKSFIGGWFLENMAVVDELLTLYRDSPKKIIAASANLDGMNYIDTSVKEATELTLMPDSTEPAYLNYLIELQKVVEKYIAEYEWCNAYAPWGIIEAAAIQHYPKGGGYKKYHTERVCAKHPFSARHLVFMTYLNDVHDGGGTEFLYQKVITPARKGLTLIWPADWTHTHRGVVSQTEEKTIITGWFDFLK